MGNLKNKKKYAPCCPIQCSIESDIENADSFRCGGCADSATIDESTRNEQLEGEDEDDHVLLAQEEK